jgi:hypothetical protein
MSCTCDDAASKIDALNTLITTVLLPRITELENRITELEKPIDLQLDATSAIKQAFGL